MLPPALKSGTATSSILGSEYSTPKYFSRASRIFTPASSMRADSFIAFDRANTLCGILPCVLSNETKSETMKAFRYVDMRGVGSNRVVVVPSVLKKIIFLVLLSSRRKNILKKGMEYSVVYKDV